MMDNKEDHKSQLHAGEYFSVTLNEVCYAWHTNSKGNYWLGWYPSNLPPVELLRHAQSIIRDLLINHPELAKEMGE